MACKIIIASLTALLSLSFAQADTIIPGGYVSGTWTAAGSPYLVQGNITVHADSILNIGPGVSVIFQGAYSFTVNGNLDAVGTETDSIHFTPVTTWSGLRFDNAPDSSHMAYCTVSGATNWGGIMITNANPVITHSTISNNQGSLWGGFYLQNSNPSISYCAISNNECNDYGGGIRMEGSSPQISYCNITGNYGMSWGGGIYCGTGAPFICGTSITGNRSSLGGGIYVGGSPVTITDCIIAADTAMGYGGGIYITAFGGSVTLNNSTISNCFAALGGGGAYVAQAAMMSITESTFESNVVGNSGGGGAIWINQAGTVSVMNTTLDDNYCGSTLFGGVIYSVTCANLIIDHCDVVNNRAAVIESGIRLNGNTAMTVKNCIFRNQQGAHIWFESYTSASISYNDFYGTPLFYYPPTGLGLLAQTNANGDSCDTFYNIYMDPLFVDFAGGDYHLAAGSPCIDAGDPASPLDPDSTVTDMGRYFYDQRVPAIELSTTQLDFGTVTIGESADLPLTLYNTGEANLVLYDFACGLTAFSTDWNPSDSLVLPGDSLEITVTFAPDDTLDYADTLCIENNCELCGVELLGQGAALGVSDPSSSLPAEFALRGPYPNPFNPTTTFRIELPVASRVSLEIFDVSGRSLGLAVDGWRTAGYHEASFEASELSSGIYLYRLDAANFSTSGKMVLLK